jgi:hypothetical protein
MGPFTVTTKRPCAPCHGTGDWLDSSTGTGQCDECGGFGVDVDRRAVATLEEARGACVAILHNHGFSALGYALPRAESGGTVGPLPDGTTIQVEPTTKQALFDALPMEDQRRLPTWPLPTLAMVIAAFNAKQAG